MPKLIDYYSNLSTASPLTLAWHDVLHGFRSYQTWLYMGWQSVRLQYKRSLIGPVWISFTSGIYILMVGYVMSSLFTMRSTELIPWIATGFITWSLFTAFLNDSSTLFIQYAAMIKYTCHHYSFYTLFLMTKSIIVFLHNFLMALGVIIFFDTPLTWHMLIVFPSLFLIMMALLPWGFLLSILSARLRDLPPMIAAIFTTGLFVTPVMWKPEQLGSEYIYIVLYNPFHHIIALIRAPLLGEFPLLLNIAVTFGVAIGGWVLLFICLTFYRQRIAFWI